MNRWYRAPELLFGARTYGVSVDIWSLGCIFAELMLRTPYLAAESDIGQLNVIFRALGTPTDDEWPVSLVNCLINDIPSSFLFFLLRDKKNGSNKHFHI